MFVSFLAPLINPICHHSGLKRSRDWQKTVEEQRQGGDAIHPDLGSQSKRNAFPLPLATITQESTSIVGPNDARRAHLVAVHHEVVCGNQGFEDHHPAGIADPLHQRVDDLGDVHVGLVLGGLDQVWEEISRAEFQRGSKVEAE